MLLTESLLHSKGIKKPQIVMKYFAEMGITSVEDLLSYWRSLSINGHLICLNGVGYKTDVILNNWMIEEDALENPIGYGALRIALRKEVIKARTGKKIDNSGQLHGYLIHAGIKTLKDLIDDKTEVYRDWGSFTSGVIGSVKLYGILYKGDKLCTETHSH